MRQHGLLEPAQALARLDPELADEGVPRVLVRLQRIRLAVAAVEREHQLAAKPLAVRVLADQRLQRRDHVGVAAEGELRLDELLARGDPLLLEPGDRRLGERLVGEVGQRCAAPEREAALERRGGGGRAAGGELPPALLEQRLEAVSVELLRGDGEDVAVLPRGQRRAAVRQRLAQARDLHVEHPRRGRRRLLAPQRVGDPLGRQRLVRVQQQEREQRAPPVPAQRDRAATSQDLERAQDAELHAGRVAGRGATLPARRRAPQPGGV